MHLLRFFLVTFLVLSLTMAASGSSNQNVVTSEGDIQSLVSQELAKDRWELVVVWATYCHICKKDFKKLQAFIEDNPEISMTLVGVVLDGLEEAEKTQALVKKHKLDYTHILTDEIHAQIWYKNATESRLVGTPSYLLYDHENELVAFNSSAIDIDALEVMVYD